MVTSRRNPLWTALALGGAWLLAGACQSTEFSYLDVGASDEVVDTAPADVPGDGVEVDAGPLLSNAGGPCELDNDCFDKGKCFTTTVVNKMFDPSDAEPDANVPGGMCTRLMCGSNDQCGPGGVCFDATPLVGSSMKLCGWPCEVYSDCRWKEGYVCYFTGKADEVQVCLPTDLVALIDCGNGTCDSWPEQNYVETKDSCPRDCQ